jgi:hypothetical protein
MTLVRPRLTDYYNISVAQTDLDFAIPFLEEDIPLYVDPFLLWKSDSMQYHSLHTSLVNAFNYQNRLLRKGQETEAINNLILASECDEVGLGLSAKRKGKRISEGLAQNILTLFRQIPEYGQDGFTHFEEIQLYVDGISKDRISDFTCSFLKSFLVDYTVQEAQTLGIPLTKVRLASLYNYTNNSFIRDVEKGLPVHPEKKTPIIFVPKHWLRHVPWINLDEYFADYCPRDEVVNKFGSDERVKVLTYNRQNYGAIEAYRKAKERTSDDCKNDPLFKQIPVTSAKKKLAELKALKPGIQDKADKRYEEIVCQLLASLLYPHLDFADTQSRTDGGASIRDLIFYNNRDIDFLQGILQDYGSRQIVMELKNVVKIERDHINQLNRYLSNEFGKFGVLVTRNPLPRAMFKSTIELWSGSRKCLIALTDADLEQMVEVFESKQRKPIDVLKKKYVEFTRACPV